MSEAIDPKAVERALRVLNEALALDPDAVNALLATRVTCTDALGEHPTVQCRQASMHDRYTVSALGLINGLFGVDEHGWGPIAAVYDCDSGRILRFESAADLATKGVTSPA